MRVSRKLVPFVLIAIAGSILLMFVFRHPSAPRSQVWQGHTYEEWRAQLAHPDAKVRTLALSGVCSLVGNRRDDLGFLLGRALGDPEEQVRSTAAAVLINQAANGHGPQMPSALPMLTTELLGSDSITKARIAMALRYWGPSAKGATRALIDALKDPVAASEAAYALRALGVAPASHIVRTVRELPLQASYHVWARAFWGGGATELEFLRALQTDESLAVRRMAEEALLMLGG